MISASSVRPRRPSTHPRQRERHANNAPDPFGDLSVSSTVLVSLLLVRLDPLGLLRRSRLTLHLLLHILRRRRNIAGCSIHCAGWRMLLISRRACCRLAAANRCGTGTRILQACSSAGVAGTCHCGANTQDDDGATRENDSFHVHLLLLCSRRATSQQGGRKTDQMAAGSGWPGKSLYCLIRRGYFWRPQTEAARPSCDHCT